MPLAATAKVALPPGSCTCGEGWVVMAAATGAGLSTTLSVAAALVTLPAALVTRTE